jgi:hypothetical protein
MSNSEHEGSSFRLTDVLVALFIVAVLTALLLPATISRSPSTRTGCANNLRQLGLALAMHEQGQRRLPGYVNRIKDQPASWVIPMLAYLERQDVLEAWKGEGRQQRPEPRAVWLNFMLCPSDARAQDGQVVTPLTYVANAGIPDALLPAGGPADKLANGLFHNRFDSPNPLHMTLSFVNDHDGAAHTIMASENVQAGQWAGNGQYDALPGGEKVAAAAGFFTPEQAERLTTIVWHPRQAQPATAVAERQINVGHAGKLDEAPTIDFARPSSFHRGGVNVVMADLRVQFISEQIDYGVYVALMTPDGANSAAPDVPISGTSGQTWRTVDQGFLDAQLNQ